MTGLLGTGQPPSWIAEFPDHYQQERALMARRWRGFLASEADLARGVLAFAGSIRVDLGATRKEYPVLLVYREDTPYRLPMVIPIQTLPAGSDWEWQHVASTNLFRLPHGYRRHQMRVASHGMLCLVETHVDRESEVFWGADLLARAELVFRAIELGNPEPLPDSADAELEAHFPPAGDVLLPDSFYQPDLGDAGYLWLSSADPSGHRDRSYQGAPMLQVGMHIDRLSAATIITASRNMETDAVVNAFPCCEDSGRIRGRWWSMDHEPAPVWNGSELAAEIARGASVADPAGLIAEDIVLRGSNRLGFVGLRFPGRDGASSWLMLLVSIEEMPDKQMQRDDPHNAMREAVLAASVYVLRVHPLCRPELERRNQDRVPSGLADKRVVLFGVGALGGDVAVTLAKAGVGHLVLVDPEPLRGVNVIRHAAGLDAVGVWKTEAVRHLVRQHNPFVDVQCAPEHATAPLRLYKLLNNADLVVSTTADENVEMAVNSAALRMGRTVIYGRALRRGTAARVFRVRPERDACKACLVQYRRDVESGENQSAAVVIPPAEGEIIARECGQAVLAGSAVDLRFAADLTARAALDELGSGVEWNNLVWVLEPWDGASSPLDVPYGVLRHSFAPHPRCPVCQTPRIHTIHFAAGVPAQLQSWAETKSPAETGGVLIGYEDAGTVYVVEATDAGPHATELPTRFLYDDEYVNERLAEALARLGDRGQYVGEWHSHPEATPRPSDLDRRSFASLAEGPLVPTNEPALFIVGVNPATKKTHGVYAASSPLGRGLNPLSLDGW
jgi:integrative and conjugative element protein (TIGR02256 family)